MKAKTIMGEQQWWMVALVLGLFAFALYANTIPNSYAMDDELVTRNHPLTSQGIKAIPEIFTSYYYDNNIGNYYEYRPIVLTSFAIEHSLFGDNAHVSHAINALLYSVLCMVLFFVIRSFKPDINFLYPALATIIFAVHPIHTEVVASIKNRDEIFSFVFGILAMFWGLKYARKGTVVEYLLFIFFILLSVMSKRSVLSYTIIIPLAACWFSQAGLVRLISISFPLMLIVLFFSPIYEQYINSLIIGGIISFPIVIWVLRTAMTEGWSAITNKAKVAIASITASSSYDASKTNGIDQSSTSWMSIAALLLLTAGSLVSLYLDLRVLIFICLSLIFLSTFLFKLSLKSYPVIVIFLIVGLIAANFQFTIIAYAIVGLLAGAFLFGGLPSFGRMISPVVAITVAAAYLFRTPKIGDSFIDVAVIIAIIVAHNFIKNKRIMPALLLVLGIMKLVLEPEYQVIWIMNLVGAVYLFIQPKIKQPMAFYTGLASAGLVTVFVLVIFPFQPVNPIYEQNLGAYYESLPDPYGDGEKTVTNVVPGAGREVDFIENPLVKEKKFGTRLGTASKVMGYYTYLLVAPVQLRFYYGFNQIEIVGLTNPIAILCLIAFLGLMVLAIWLYKRDAMLSFALLYLLFGLVFISNLGVLLTGIVAERLAFGTSLGYCLILAWGLVKLFKLDLSGSVNLKQLKPTFLIVVVAIIGLYGTRTIVRNTNWKDKLTLYTHDANMSPNSAKVQQMLGNEYLNMGIRDEANQDKHFALAEKYLKNSLAVNPRFHSALLDLGHMYSLKEDCKNAVVYLEQFIAVSPPPPLVLFHYAICLDMVGRYTEALTYYERYVASEPYNADGYSNLSYLYFRMGKIDKALEVCKSAIAVIPNDPNAYINVGKVYLESKRPVESIPYFEKAYTLNPNDLNTVLQLWDLHTQIGDPARGQFMRERALALGHKF
jgi:Tfp pilus assembly protein PilF